MATQKTIEYVKPVTNQWNAPDGGVIHFITINFSDGTEGSIGTIESKVPEVMKILEDLKGKPAEFELEEKGVYNGVQQFKVKSYPGKPSGGGGGGRGGGGGMSHAQAGIMAAASYLGAVDAASTPEGSEVDLDLAAEAIIELGEKLTEHLFTRRKDEKQDEAAPSGNGSSSPPSITLAQMKALKEIIEANGWTPEDVETKTGVKSLAELSGEDAGILIESWQ